MHETLKDLRTRLGNAPLKMFLPTKRSENDVLTSQMVGIGINFAAKVEANANIEDTLIYASELGMGKGGPRVLLALTT